MVGLVWGLLGGLVLGPFLGLVLGLAAWLVLGMPWGLAWGLSLERAVGLGWGLLGGLLFGLAVGLLGALAHGGYACLSHLALRLVLWDSNAMPWRYARFLDYAAERLVLRKVGGSYIFVHRLLLDYFASLETTTVKAGSRE